MTPFDELVRTQAEHAYVRVQEVHPYTGLTSGLAFTIRERVPLDNPNEIAHLFHDPLASLAEYWHNGKFTSERVVEAMDDRFDYGVGLTYELQRVLDNGFPRSPEPSISLGWIKKRWDTFLKDKKIRRGSQRYKAAISEHKDEVIETATHTVQLVLDEYAREIEKEREALTKLAEEAHKAQARFEHKAEVLGALLDVAELSPLEKSVSARRSLRAMYERLSLLIEDQFETLDDRLGEFDADRMVRETMSRDPELKLFLEE